ncbi:LysR family transcriptional regulator [Microbacterium elymi]|uniref:LysR family transcriptional regulator n=1 Tax=Microbacterium elymi TaxID=2909587 RepID=A0ABY5NHW9_9MICO|nr:LysR family transcriptional regulator [Microbacterium elymi]UUT34691.1 LysR family transcriptional regulator [Microbacterium elymi]
MLQTSFTLRQLEYFVATAETGKIRAAADRCHISPVSLGVALSELERGLGVQPAIRRRAKGITLTPNGKEVLAMARDVLTKASDLQVAADETAEQLAGTLRIGCHTALGLAILPEVCDTFASAHPALRIGFRDDSQDKLQAASWRARSRWPSSTSGTSRRTSTPSPCWRCNRGSSSLPTIASLIGRRSDWTNSPMIR